MPLAARPRHSRCGAVADQGDAGRVVAAVLEAARGLRAGPRAPVVTLPVGAAALGAPVMPMMPHMDPEASGQAGPEGLPGGSAALHRRDGACRAQPWVAAAAWSSKPDQLAQSLGDGLGHAVAAGLHHHPDQGLGAARAAAGPAPLAEPGLLLGHRRPPRVGPVQQLGVGDRHVDQDLGHPGHQAVQQLSATGPPLDQVGQDQAGQQAVAGGGQPPEDDVTGLLATEGEARPCPARPARSGPPPASPSR